MSKGKWFVVGKPRWDNCQISLSNCDKIPQRYKNVALSSPETPLSSWRVEGGSGYETSIGLTTATHVRLEGHTSSGCDTPARYLAMHCSKLIRICYCNVSWCCYQPAVTFVLFLPDEGDHSLQWFFELLKQIHNHKRKRFNLWTIISALLQSATNSLYIYTRLVITAAVKYLEQFWAVHGQMSSCCTATHMQAPHSWQSSLFSFRMQPAHVPHRLLPRLVAAAWPALAREGARRPLAPNKNRSRHCWTGEADCSLLNVL